jgi:hypothetical protein
MDSKPVNKSSSAMAGRGSTLLQAILAIFLAIVSQLVLRDGHTLLAVAGYAAAVVLFVISVKEFLAPSSAAQEEAAVIGETLAGAQGMDVEGAAGHTAAAVTVAETVGEPSEITGEGAGEAAGLTEAGDETAARQLTPSQSAASASNAQIKRAKPSAEECEAEIEVGGPKAAAVRELDRSEKVRYLRLHWRLLTLAEVLRFDIPPAREGLPEFIPAAVAEAPTVLPQAAARDWNADAPEDIPKPPAPEPATAASPKPSSTMVKVTSWGDVLVLDTGREQLQRFDDQGGMLATYSLPGLAAFKVLDLDLTPDFKTLYVVDAAGRLRVFTLAGKDSPGDAADAS